MQEMHYQNLSNNDSFLAVVVRRGSLVGGLAKSHFSGGRDIVSLDSGLALSQPQAFADASGCAIFEAESKYQNCFSRRTLSRHERSWADFLFEERWASPI